MKNELISWAVARLTGGETIASPDGKHPPVGHMAKAGPLGGVRGLRLKPLAKRSCYRPADFAAAEERWDQRERPTERDIFGASRT